MMTQTQTLETLKLLTRTEWSFDGTIFATSIEWRPISADVDLSVDMSSMWTAETADVSVRGVSMMAALENLFAAINA